VTFPICECARTRKETDYAPYEYAPAVRQLGANEANATFCFRVNALSDEALTGIKLKF
jgi:hypothetical protein